MPVTCAFVSRCRSALALAAALLAAGCCETYKCSPPNAQVTVRDEAGRPLDGAAVMASSGAAVDRSCAAGVCRHLLHSRELITLMVAAPGYKPVSFDVRPRSDECGNAVTQEYDVVLAGEGETTASRFRILSNFTCE